MRQLQPHEYWYVKAARLEKRRPHWPIEMKSVQSKSTPFVWECPICIWGAHAYTYQSDAPPPVCSGGLKHSFQTVTNESR